ncbi:MAG: ADP-ribosylglycohydrolase family protein [Planctomycetota bacterium]
MSPETPNLSERVRGAFLGAAVGSALGAPFEFMSASQIQIRHGRITDLIGGGWRGNRAGEYTEDVAMMLCLTESLLASGSFEEDDVARRYLRWYGSGPKHASNIVKAALEGAAETEGGLVEASARAADNLGDERLDASGLLRAIPLGLLYHRSPERVVEACVSEARLTHHDKHTGSIAASVGLLVAGLVQRLDKRAALSWMSEELSRSVALNMLPTVETWPKSSAPGPEAVDALLCVVRTWLDHRGYRDAVQTQVQMGGDSDTCGALIGALAGARYGAGVIPKEWSDRLEDRRLIEEISDRFAVLVAGASGGSRR